MTELDTIALIRLLAGSPEGRLLVGIGDDCAAWQPRPGLQLLFTTDQLIEGVHYRKSLPPSGARRAGARLVGRGLSDIAAMGGDALLVFLSLALPPGRGRRWRVEFLRGFAAAARRYGVAWAGGDLSSTSGPVVASVTVVGEVPRGAALLRSGARPRDRVFVTGVLGRAPQVITPRLAVGRFLSRRRLATAAIDLSDGLSTDLGHLTQASFAGAIVKAGQIPKAGRLKEALHRGEDYELLFTARPSARIPSRIAGVPIREIGRITRRREVLLEHPDGRRERLVPRGWEHFRS